MIDDSGDSLSELGGGNPFSQRYGKSRSVGGIFDEQLPPSHGDFFEISVGTSGCP